MVKKCIVIVFVISIIVCLLLLAKQHIEKTNNVMDNVLYNNTYQFILCDDAESKKKYDDIYFDIVNLSLDDYIFIFRKMRTDGHSTTQSCTMALSNDNKLYLCYGYQPYVEDVKKVNSAESYTNPQKMEFVTTKYAYISDEDKETLVKKLNSIYNEYKNEKVENTLTKYPPSWEYKCQLFFDNDCLDFAPQIFDLNDWDKYNEGYSEYDTSFKPLNLPKLKQFYVYIDNIINSNNDSDFFTGD